MNPNIHYATIFVNSLAASGLHHVCIAPGSRSTPLTLAFDAHPEIEVHLQLDERCAAFFALGLALATDAPVAMVCTSGSAAANFFPAIIEANMSQVPLLVLTADRPHELRHSGANQTIDQIKLYGDHALWAVDAPLPEQNPPAVALRNIETLATRAYATANGIRKGVVQVNFPFRKPLEPREGDRGSGIGSQFRTTFGRLRNSQFLRGIIKPTPEQVEQLEKAIASSPNGLIICGPRCPGGDFPQAVASLSQASGYPLLADPISGVRFGEWVADTAVLSTYETFMQQWETLPKPDVIIRFGAVPISKWLNSYLADAPDAIRIHIRSNGVWADDSHLVTHFLQVDETAVCQQLVARLGEGAKGRGARSEGTTALVEADQATEKIVKEQLEKHDFDGSGVADVVQALPEDALLFMGNSLPIRHLDQYGFASSKKITAYASRGASGIDGNISTALGMHVGSGKKLVLVLGDITFYHDMNGLLYVKQMSDNNHELDITIIVINNDGGGIFNRLPISNIDPPFTKLFITPHGLNFEDAARLYGLAYEQVSFLEEDGRSHFQIALQAALNTPTPTLIELQTDGKRDDVIRKEINKRVKDEG